MKTTMTQEDVIALMESSTSEEDWNRNTDAVKKACGGYPSFWYTAIVHSGLLERVANTFGSDGKIHIT